MARNRVQFQKGYSLVQFMDEYGRRTSAERRCFVGAGRTDSFAQDASTPGTVSFKADGCISAGAAGIKSR